MNGLRTGTLELVRWEMTTAHEDHLAMLIARGLNNKLSFRRFRVGEKISIGFTLSTDVGGAFVLSKWPQLIQGSKDLH